jgi:hypothetical protein
MTGDGASTSRRSGRSSRVASAHAVIASRAQVLGDRRALYRLAVQMAGGRPDVPTAVLDDPVSRFRVGEVIAGRQPAAGLRLRSVAEVAAGAPGSGPRIAGAPDAQEALAPALRAVAFETGAPDAEVGLLTAAAPDRFPAAAAEVRAGVDLARALVPDLLADLIGHVALIGLLDPGRCGTVVSASSRYVPGLVLLRPGRPLEVAESFVHEAAHQRFFDLAITRDLLRAESDGRPGFRPSWRSTTWPIEQTLAAFHAYACLVELADSVPPAELTAGVGVHSVLPGAPERAAEIGAWLVEHGDWLGVDADRLVRALLGLPAADQRVAARPPATGPGGSRGVFRAQECVVVPAADGRRLVGVPGPPLRFYWLDADAAAVLGILQSAGPVPVEAIARDLAGVPGADDLFTRVASALDTLVVAELAVAG